MTQIGKVKNQSGNGLNLVFLFISGFIIAFIIFDAIGVNLIGTSTNKSDFYKRDTYQSIFLTNGSVFFGKVTNQSDTAIEIDDVYYLKASAIQQQDVAVDANNLALVKVTDDIHSPENRAEIRLDQVLFIQNLDQNSKVLQSIRGRIN